MSKRKHIKVEGGGLLVQWIGPERKNNNYRAYVRFGIANTYLGALSDSQAKQLMRWLNKYYGGSQ